MLRFGDGLLTVPFLSKPTFPGNCQGLLSALTQFPHRIALLLLVGSLLLKLCRKVLRMRKLLHSTDVNGIHWHLTVGNLRVIAYAELQVHAPPSCGGARTREASRSTPEQPRIVLERH